MKNIDVTERAFLQLSAEFFNVFNWSNVEYSGFNTVYGSGVDLNTGDVIGPQPRFMQLMDEVGGFDRNNRQIPGVNPFQVQFGARFFF